MVNVREIRDADYRDWLPHWLDYLAFCEMKLDEAVTRETWRRFFVEGYHKCLVAVDHDSHVIGGFATYLMHPSTWKLNGYCYLEDLFVAPALRGQRIGEILIPSVVRIAADSGMDRVYWHTDQSNHVAQRLYDRVGERSPVVQYRINSIQHESSSG